MSNNFNYKKKNNLLLIGSIVFMMAAYFLAYRSTIELYFTCSELDEKLAKAANAPREASLIKKKLAEIENTIGMMDNSEINVQQSMLGIITHYCQANEVLLKEFPETMLTVEKDFLIETNVFTVEGGFNKILRLVYLLEQKNKTGRLASVYYYTKKDFKTKQTSLLANIYLQNVKKIKHEK